MWKKWFEEMLMYSSASLYWYGLYGSLLRSKVLFKTWFPKQGELVGGQIGQNYQIFHENYKINILQVILRSRED